MIVSVPKITCFAFTKYIVKGASLFGHTLAQPGYISIRTSSHAISGTNRTNYTYNYIYYLAHIQKNIKACLHIFVITLDKKQETSIYAHNTMQHK